MCGNTLNWKESIFVSLQQSEIQFKRLLTFAVITIKQNKKLFTHTSSATLNLNKVVRIS